MFKNYLLISLRNLQKHFSYSLINIFGLTVGLTTCLLLASWIGHELSYDRFHERAPVIYRGSMEMSFGGRDIKTSVSPTALLPTMLEFPEVKTGVRIYNAASWNAFVVRKDDKVFQETHFYYADSSFFDVFSFQLIKGNAQTALKEPNSVILTKSGAKKYFGEQDPIGGILKINNQDDYIITGVVEDVPSNSFLQFDFLASFSSLAKAQRDPEWWSANDQTFIVVEENTDIAALTRKTDQAAMSAVAADITNPNDFVHYNFIRLTDIHLRSPYDTEFEVVGDITYVYIFSGVALLILLIACINYINLATARAMHRAKEVGIRKVAGALRRQLVIQFIGESAVITIISFVLAFFAAQILIPVFNNVTGKDLNLNSFYNPSFGFLSVILLVSISLLSGAYPAFAITAFKPVNILKGNFKFSGHGLWLRKVLVVTQFSISILLLVGTMVIMKQLDFIQNKKLGFNKENVLVLPLDQGTEKVYSQLRTEFVRSGVVSNAGLATESPTLIQGGYGFNLDELREDQGILVNAVAADTGFIPTLKMNILEGRNFSAGDLDRMRADTLYSFIVNNAMLQVLHLSPQDAIGKKASLSGRKGEVVGVIDDFHFSSLHSEIGPLVIFNEIDYNHIFLRLTTTEVSAALEKLKAISATVNPHRPFEYQFLDQQYGAMYSSEQRMGDIFIIFATIAIVIACLGLLGLVSFSAAQKTREIGIRKVLGATAGSIVLLITKEFTKLVFIAIVLGVPLSYWIMNQWLADFAYKAPMGIGPFIVAAIVSLAIAFATAGYQAIKAALIDPAKTLRND